MDKSAGKRKINIVVIVAALLVIISGVSIFAIVTGSQQDQTDNVTKSNDDRSASTSDSLQQDVSNMNASVDNEAKAYADTKAAFEDKNKIKVAN